jgi:hypothetical protein
MISSSDLKFYLSGGTTNTLGDSSLGGIISTTEVSPILNKLFDEVTGTEHESGDTEYRAIYFKNNSADTGYNVKLWIESNSTGVDSELSIGKESSSGSPIQTISNESTAPIGITFSTAAGQSNALSLGTMNAGVVYGIWLKRVITAGTTPQANDTAQIKVYVDYL